MLLLLFIYLFLFSILSFCRFLFSMPACVRACARPIPFYAQHKHTFTFSLDCILQKRSQEKAKKRHDNVMRLLVRRFITAEQRKRDDFGITEDDVMEIRQDISTLRFELIDIFNTNGMKTPSVNPKDVQCN